MSKTPRGVRQVNENLVQKGRAFIITDEDFNNFNWNDLPDGTLHVDPNNGNISVKLKGETTWSPTGLKDDGTLVISRDTQFTVEVFTVTDIDIENETFTYTNTDGEKRHKPVLNNGEYFVFELEKGTYLQGRNHLEVTLDDVLVRTVMSGGIEEISEIRFAVAEKLEIGHEVTVRYVKWAKIGNPYPRFFLSKTEPETAEVGDFWLDTDASSTEGDIFDDFEDEPEKTISWDQITGKPTSLVGYKIKDPVAMKGHVHRALDITDFPLSLPANGGDADTVNGLKPGNSPGDIPILNSDGKLDFNIFPPNFLVDTGAIYIQSTRPTDAKNKAIWICTDPDSSIGPHIEVLVEGTWIKVGAVWK